MIFISILSKVLYQQLNWIKDVAEKIHFAVFLPGPKLAINCKIKDCAIVLIRSNSYWKWLYLFILFHTLKTFGEINI